MSLTYGYDLNDGDKIMAAPIETTELMSRILLPGAVLVNYLPFCMVLYFITPMLVSHSDSQCGIFFHGSRFSAASH